MLGRIFVALQHVLPQHALSRLAHRSAQICFKPAKNLQIGLVRRLFNVDMGEAAEPDPFAYPTFNAFFTRRLKDDARSIGDAAVVSPCDGTVSAAGIIKQGQLFQAKGRSYSAEELLAGDASAFGNGSFMTIYLSPRDCHRYYLPMDAALVETRHVPGALFSVNDTTTRHVDRLFARNERVVCLFDTEQGKLAMVMVGAMLVSSIAINADGWPGKHAHIAYQKGQEFGWFNYGSTIILLTEQQLLAERPAGSKLQIGEGLSDDQGIRLS